LQVCGLPALHCFSAAVHARHTPLLHGESVQAMPFIQRPVASHVCTVLFEHRVGEPGTHSPAHLFVAMSHTNVQATAAAQCPFTSHVCTMFAVHRVVPGSQSPAQFPSTHAFVQRVCGWLVPVMSHR
jgi:hypothetical protein